jgi:predicted acetylornithine/succinylornithine family transaminase
MDLLTREAASFFSTYKRLPLDIARGEGMYLMTTDGKRYLDMFAGIAVNILGHAHPRIVRAITEQAGRYIHVSNYFAQEPQVRLAELLLHHTDSRKVFFCNSGTEAIEGAVKIARRWGAPLGKTGIVAFSNAFHGRTMGALSLMDRASYREGFGPFLAGCMSIPFNDPTALAAAVGPTTAAVLLECIQGEGGIRPVSPSFIATLQDLRTRHGMLVIADEIQSGVGRTGRFLAADHCHLQPDLVTLAKPIGGGLPLGAILGGPTVAATLQPGMHGTTFGGNPVACAAGIAVLEELEERNLLAHATAMGERLMEGLRDLCRTYPDLCKEVRGMGLMVGLELHREGDPVVSAMRERGVLINCTDKTVLRFVPPLIVEKDHIAATLESLDEVLKSLH